MTPISSEKRRSCCHEVKSLIHFDKILFRLADTAFSKNIPRASDRRDAAGTIRAGRSGCHKHPVKNCTGRR